LPATSHHLQQHSSTSRTNRREAWRPIRAIHHGVDSGQGFLKFDLTVEFETKCDSLISDQSCRRVILIAVCPEVAESNSVFAEIYRLLLLPVEQHFHSFHVDLKAIAYATGIGDGSASHSCPFCYTDITISGRWSSKW